MNKFGANSENHRPPSRNSATQTIERITNVTNGTETITITNGITTTETTEVAGGTIETTETIEREIVGRTTETSDREEGGNYW